MDSAYGSPFRSGYGGNGMYGAGALNANQNSTQAAFDLLNSFVQSFASVAGVLEATLHATFQSFQAMMAVADHVGSLKSALVNALSIGWLFRRIKMWLTGEQDFASEFKDLGGPDSAVAKEGHASIRKKPILLFLALVFGFPYLLTKLVKFLSERLQQEQRKLPMDPSRIELARALYDFVGATPQELTLKKGDLVAVLDKPQEAPGWWRGKTEMGPIGYFPCNYVEIIRKAENKDVLPAASPDAASTLQG
jgi:peroxin-13